MGNEITGREVTFSYRMRPLYECTEDWTAYPQDDLKAFVAFTAVFPEETMKKIFARCGVDAPSDPTDAETYILVFCDKSKNTIRQRRVDLCVWYGRGHDDEAAFTLSPDEAESIMAQFDASKYGFKEALDFVKKEENTHGDKVKKYAEGVEYHGNFAEDLAKIAAAHPSWKKGSGMDR